LIGAAAIGPTSATFFPRTAGPSSVSVSDAEDPKTPIDQALDVFVYLPVGFLLEFPRSIPRYIERGRRQFDTVKRIGREAMPAGSSPGEQIDRLQAQTRNTLRALGVVPGNGTNGARPSPAPRVPPGDQAPFASSTTRTTSASDRSDGTVEHTATVTHLAPVEPGIDPETLAIPDYDSLSASQVVPRLDSLSLDELELVRQYESAKRGRKTILSKIAQLQAS
jgi:hypothetical protein